MIAVSGPNEVAHVIKGSFDVGTQYHFTMETQQCVCVPTEDGMDVYPTTQWLDITQVGIAEVLNIPENRYVLCSSSEWSVVRNVMLKTLHCTRFHIFHSKDTCFPTLFKRQIYVIYKHVSTYSAYKCEEVLYKSVINTVIPSHM
jgi:hypothetical protein